MLGVAYDCDGRARYPRRLGHSVDKLGLYLILIILEIRNVAPDCDGRGELFCVHAAVASGASTDDFAGSARRDCIRIDGAFRRRGQSCTRAVKIDVALHAIVLTLSAASACIGSNGTWYRGYGSRQAKAAARAWIAVAGLSGASSTSVIASGACQWRTDANAGSGQTIATSRTLNACSDSGLPGSIVEESGLAWGGTSRAA